MSLSINGNGFGSMLWETLNTGLGAAGTAMGATALGSKTSEEKVREIIRNEYGKRNGNSDSETLVNRYELAQNQEIARLQAKEYSDMSDLKLFDDYTTKMNAERERVNNRLETIFQELVASRERQQAEICRIDKEAALNKQAQDYQAAMTSQGIQSLTNAVANVNGRIDAFTKTIIPASNICPQPLAACSPVSLQGQIITTTPTGDTTTVVAGRTAVSK